MTKAIIAPLVKPEFQADRLPTTTLPTAKTMSEAGDPPVQSGELSFALAVRRRPRAEANGSGSTVLVGAVAKREIDVVFVTELTRISRKPGDSETLMLIGQANGVCLQANRGERIASFGSPLFYEGRK